MNLLSDVFRHQNSNVEESPENNSECVICLEDVPYTPLPCNSGHIICKDCTLRYITQDDSRYGPINCPFCKKPFDVHDYLFLCDTLKEKSPKSKLKLLGGRVQYGHSKKDKLVSLLAMGKSNQKDFISKIFSGHEFLFNGGEKNKIEKHILTLIGDPWAFPKEEQDKQLKRLAILGLLAIPMENENDESLLKRAHLLCRRLYPYSVEDLHLLLPAKSREAYKIYEIEEQLTERAFKRASNIAPNISIHHVGDRARGNRCYDISRHDIYSNKPKLQRFINMLCSGLVLPMYLITLWSLLIFKISLCFTDALKLIHYTINTIYLSEHRRNGKCLQILSEFLLGCIEGCCEAIKVYQMIHILTLCIMAVIRKNLHKMVDRSMKHLF